MVFRRKRSGRSLKEGGKQCNFMYNKRASKYCMKNRGRGSKLRIGGGLYI